MEVVKAKARDALHRGLNFRISDNSFRSAAGNSVSRIFAVDPRPAEPLVGFGRQQATCFTAVPADDLVGFAALLAALFPCFGPTGVGLDRLGASLSQKSASPLR